MCKSYSGYRTRRTMRLVPKDLSLWRILEYLCKRRVRLLLDWIRRQFRLYWQCTWHWRICFPLERWHWLARSRTIDQHTVLVRKIWTQFSVPMRDQDGNVLSKDRTASAWLSLGIRRQMIHRRRRRQERIEQKARAWLRAESIVCYAVSGIWILPTE